MGELDLGIGDDAAATQLTGATHAVGIGCSRSRQQRGCDKDVDDGEDFHIDGLKCGDVICLYL